MARPAEESLRARALKLLERRSYAEAAEQFRRVVRLSSATADDHACLAQALSLSGRLVEAEAALRQAITMAPGAADLHACLGQVLVQAGRPVLAIPNFQRAVSLQPGHWAAADLVAAKAQISQSVHSWHLPMLADSARNAAFADAIAVSVRPDDIVLDIGTGSGLLAMMAARAGARHVYACEMLPDLADLARIVVAENGFADRITVIAKPSSDLLIGVDLPARAAMLVTEIFDALLIGEGALPAISHAREHLLTPDARIIPAGGAVVGQLVTIPRLKTLFPLRDLCGFDLRTFAAQALDKQFYPVIPEVEAFTALSAPARIVNFEFAGRIDAEKTWNVTIKAEASGAVQALLLWLDLRMDKTTILSSGPGGTARHWNPVVFLFDTERHVDTGEIVTIRCRMGANVFHFALPD
jgi:precorrin-6B methylase 2